MLNSKPQFAALGFPQFGGLLESTGFTTHYYPLRAETECKRKQTNIINCNAADAEIDCENWLFRRLLRLWCSGSTVASQAPGEGSIPFSRFLMRGHSGFERMTRPGRWGLLDRGGPRWVCGRFPRWFFGFAAELFWIRAANPVFVVAVSRSGLLWSAGFLLFPHRKKEDHHATVFRGPFVF